MVIDIAFSDEINNNRASKGIKDTNLTYEIPFFGDIIEGVNNKKLNELTFKAKNNPQSLTSEEIVEFDKYIDTLKKEQIYGNSIVYNLGRSIVPSLSYSAEFGIRTAALSRFGITGMIGSSTITALDPARLFKTYQAKQLNGDIVITDKGEAFFGELQKDPIKTMYKSYVINLASDLSEQFGDLIFNNSFTKKLINKTTGTKKKVLELLLGVSEKTKTPLSNLFNGFIPEHIESYIEKPLTQILGGNDNEYTWDNLAKSFEAPSWEEFLLTSGVIAIQGFAMHSSQRMINKMTSKGINQEDIDTYIKTRSPLDVEKDLMRIQAVETQQEKQAFEDWRNKQKDTLTKAGFTEQQVDIHLRHDHGRAHLLLWEKERG